MFVHILQFVVVLVHISFQSLLLGNYFCPVAKADPSVCYIGHPMGPKLSGSIIENNTDLSRLFIAPLQVDLS